VLHRFVNAKFDLSVEKQASFPRSILHYICLLRSRLLPLATYTVW
jgi:hypothetical protein